MLCLEVDALFGDVEVFLLNAVDELLLKRSFFYAPELLLLENHEKRTVDSLSYRRRQNCDGLIQLLLDSCRLVCAPQGVKQFSVGNVGIFVNSRPTKTQTTNV